MALKGGKAVSQSDLEGELREGALTLGVKLDGPAIKRFMAYLQELMRWGTKVNLTGPATEEDIIRRHFLDSLSLLPILSELKCRKVLDMGSGAGFPGLALKIADPTLDIILLDSREKRVFFLRHVLRALGLGEGISAIHSRAEALSPDLANAFDCVTSRAFSALSAFLPLATPYARQGGFIIAMKGPRGLEEAEGLEPEGLEGPRIERMALPFDEREGFFIIFKKT